MSYKIKNVTVLLFIILLSCASSHSIQTPPTAENKKNSSTIKIASFNMQIFGKTKLARIDTLTVLAKIASNFDIIALQEIGSNKSSSTDDACRAIMDIYVSRIKEVSCLKQYSYIRGNQYAIVYRTDRVQLNNYSVYAGSRTLSYNPLIANFRTVTPGSNFDFSIVTIHTSPGKAGVEIPALKTVMEETETLYSDPDVLCLGDFNADGSYYNEGNEEWLSGFEPETYITGIPNYCDTTVAASDNTYDRMQMKKSLNSDFTGNFGVFRFGEEYDVSGCEGGRTTTGTEKAVSDHYPVWCEFYTDRDTD